jgi:hypothetical protein
VSTFQRDSAVADCLGKEALAADPEELGFEELLKALRQRHGVFASCGGAAVRRLSAHVTFYGEQSRDLVESLEGVWRRRLVVNIAEVPPGMAPACDLTREASPREVVGL